MDNADIKRNWAAQAILTVLVIYFYVFMEWLFFVTKPSFMSKLGFIETMQLLFVTPIPLIVICVAGLFLCFIPAIIVRKSFSQRVCPSVGLLIPVLILAASFFLLIENFTYTIFHFGVRLTSGVYRLAYGFLILILVVFTYQYMHDFKKRLIRPALFRKYALIAAGILSVSVLFAVVAYNSSGITAIKLNEDVTSRKNRPNILLICSDGLNAENMSVYGYHRDTTPFVRELAENALLCENCFTNADASGASIASMFTGKLPTQTRLFYPPEILKGKDAYRHLPGILKKLGYRNIDVSVRHHADPYDLNMRNSFDRANFRDIKENYASAHVTALLGQDSYYFAHKMRDRITIRLLHVFGALEMEDPLGEVGISRKKNIRDARRISDFLSFIKGSSNPFFAHLHLLGTHGPTFRLSMRRYSAGQGQSKPWKVDFYDDAILSFDHQVREIIRGLRRFRKLDNTVIVICTDHGQRWKVNVRVPLIFIFPNGEHSGRIQANVQNLDIAPTILDYLGIQRPDWMGGQSLLSSNVERQRNIFTVVRKRGILLKESKGHELDKSKTAPPFYSLGSIGVIYRDKYYKLDLEESVLTLSNIKGHTSPCGEEDFPDPEKVGRLIIEHLVDSGYDTSSIKTPLSIH